MIAGGKPDGDSRLAGVNIYDPHSQQWTTAAPLLEPRGGFGMATAGDSIYAVGGRGTSFALRSVEIYDSQRSGTFCDVILEVDNSLKAKSEPTAPTSVRAHKNVLAAASPYFRETLSSDSYMESKEIRIVVKDTDCKTLGLLVDYMYTGRLDINEKNVWALFGAAKILRLDSVRSGCTR
ncbi:unnamed protein product [Nippostrongylus brasiliensis]|uniref:BTB domain-containing protein n=1 Tax=Nippostrongylus brasiliensis TaxID=27835 RepID=A0A0N4Y7Q2_NIPBR|nr:unnamed protein product [Nippostrongylus brasiliensis]